MMESVIRLENFYFAYNKSELVLQDIDLEIKKGSFTVVAGPSGAGKTTLCKAMTGIVPFYMGGRYSGDVQVLGESTKGRRVSDIAMRVGLMLEDYESQLVSLTAGEEVAFSLLNHGLRRRRWRSVPVRLWRTWVCRGAKAISWTSCRAGSASVCCWRLLWRCIQRSLCWMSRYRRWDPDGAHSLYELLYAIHQRYGTTIIVVEHRVDYLLPYVTDMVVLKEGQLVTADTFAAAARTMYEDEELRPLVPALWQVKLGVERRFGITLGEWRTEAEAAAELQLLGFEGGNA